MAACKIAGLISRFVGGFDLILAGSQQSDLGTSPMFQGG